MKLTRLALAATLVACVSAVQPPARANDLGCAVAAGPVEDIGIGIAGDPTQPSPERFQLQDECRFWSMSGKIAWWCDLGALGSCAIGSQNANGDPVLGGCSTVVPKRCQGVITGVPPAGEVVVTVRNGWAAAWDCAYFGPDSTVCSQWPTAEWPPQTP